MYKRRYMYIHPADDKPLKLISSCKSVCNIWQWQQLHEKGLRISPYFDSKVPLRRPLKKQKRQYSIATSYIDIFPTPIRSVPIRCDFKSNWDTIYNHNRQIFLPELFGVSPGTGPWKCDNMIKLVEAIHSRSIQLHSSFQLNE